MNKKKYTLYFKGLNKYGHEHNIPIITLDLKEMDKYTSNYKNCLDLYNCLPDMLKDFIKENLSYNIDLSNNDILSDLFFITDNDFNPIMNVIFEDDIDVLYINPDEVDDLILKEKMTIKEYQDILFNNYSKSEFKKYTLFKYLYETYVEGEKIEGMIDVYDTNNLLPNLSSKELMVASIATERDNIIVLCKKLCQYEEARRNLTFKYKELFKKIENANQIIRYKKVLERRKKLNVSEIKNNILDNFIKFKRGYNKEYNI